MHGHCGNTAVMQYTVTMLAKKQNMDPEYTHIHITATISVYYCITVWYSIFL